MFTWNIWEREGDGHRTEWVFGPRPINGRVNPRPYNGVW